MKETGKQRLKPKDQSDPGLAPRLYQLLALVLRPWFTLPLIVFLAYFLLNLRIDGPAYLSDEVGYLDKAATIAGSVVHLSTSWFGGYSFMVSPAYFLSSNPFFEWRVVLALNALMWAGSALLLSYVVGRIYPKMTLPTRRLVVLGAMLYPAWVAMSGYAFSTSGFVLVYMAALVCLLKSDLVRTNWLLLAGLSAGYLCWIHPVGFIFLALFVVFLAGQAILRKQWSPIIGPLASLVIAGSYFLAVRPWFNAVMRGNTGNDAHYGLVLESTLQHLALPGFWLQFALLIVGISFYVLVSTFGVALYGILPLAQARTKADWKKTVLEPAPAVTLLSLAVLVGVILFTAAATAGLKQLRIDQWVYGRYADMYLLPLLGIGLAAVWRVRSGLLTAGFIFMSGIALSIFTNHGNTNDVFNNKVNLQGLWSMHVASIIHANHYWLWGLLGAAGIALVAFMGHPKRKAWLCILIIPLALGGLGNYLYHRTILQYAAVSPLYQDVKDRFKPTDCIGYSTGSDPHWQYNLYSYYLHGYNMQKMTLHEWEQEDCNGAYITPTFDSKADPELTAIGYYPQNDLYLLVRKSSTLLPHQGPTLP